LVGVHIPSISDKQGKENHWETVVQYAKVKQNTKCVMTGDFNTGLPEDSEGIPFRLSEYMKELHSMEWIDAWRVFNTKVNDFTWYSHKNNGFRLDYVYMSPILKDNIIVSYHSHKERI